MKIAHLTLVVSILVLKNHFLSENTNHLQKFPMQKVMRLNIAAMSTSYSKRINHVAKLRIWWLHQQHLKTRTMMMMASQVVRWKIMTMTIAMHIMYLQNQHVPHHKTVVVIITYTMQITIIILLIIMLATIMYRYSAMAAQPTVMVPLSPTRMYVVLIMKCRLASDQLHIIATHVVITSLFQ